MEGEFDVWIKNETETEELLDIAVLQDDPLQMEKLKITNPLNNEIVGVSQNHSTTDEGVVKIIGKPKSPKSKIPKFMIPSTEKFTCEYCYAIFTTRDGYRRHVRKQHNIEPNTLVCCKTVFPTVDKFIRHKEIHKLNISCKLCSKVFSRKTSLTSHIKRVHNNMKYVSCAHCNKSFGAKADVLKHLLKRICTRPPRVRTRVVRYNKKKKPAPAKLVECQYCMVQYQEFYLPQHYAICRSNLYQCKTCELVIFDMDQYNRHIEIHPDNTLFKCTVCAVTFLHRWEYTRHASTHEIRQFACDVCHKMFKNKAKRRAHMILHSGIRYQCDLCGTNFVKKNGLEKHMIEKHVGLRPFMCDTCGLSFARISDLQRHINCIHIALRPFTCTVCNRAFKQKYTLNKHMLIHRDSKPFKCNLCDKSYTQSNSLREHQILHSNPLRCKICYHPFTRLKRLSEHYRLKNCKPVDPGSIALPPIQQHLPNKIFEDEIKTFTSASVGSTHENMYNNVYTPVAENNVLAAIPISNALPQNTIVKSPFEQFEVLQPVVPPISHIKNDCQGDAQLDNELFTNDNNYTSEEETMENKHIPKVMLTENVFVAPTKSVEFQSSFNIKQEMTDSIKEEKSDRKDHNYSPFENDFQLNYCESCDKQYSNKQSYRYHMRTKHKVIEHRLTCCATIFPTLKKFARHQEIHKLNIKCTICDKMFGRKSALKLHMVSAHQPDTVFVCEHCNKVFSGKNNVKKHLLGGACLRPTKKKVKVVQILDQKVYCPFCDVLYKTKYSLTQHLLRCRSNLRRCKVCDLVLFDLKQFAKHSAIHPENKLLDCSLCDQQFLHVWEHTKHFGTHIGKYYKCDVCVKSFKTKSQKNEHMMYHADKKNFECDICGKYFVRKVGIAQHMSEIHIGIKKFICDTCGVAFSRSGDLKRHIECVHSEARPFKCHVCDKSFKRIDQLKTHQYIHDESKPFKCDMCDKSYSQSSSLKEHQILHNNPLKCKTCDRSFTRMNRLREHYNLNNCRMAAAAISST